jgi:hypothetical protein
VTVLVGVRCADGVVIGADSIATSSMGHFPLIHLEADAKIQIFNDAVIMATTGPVGFSQRLHHHIDAAVKGGVFNNFTARDATTNISQRLLKDLQESRAPTWPQDGLRFGGLMAAAVKDGPFLAEFGTTDFQAEMKTGKIFFGSMGSGQMLADPFLAFVCRVLWKNEMPTVDHGKFGVSTGCSLTRSNWLPARSACRSAWRRSGRSAGSGSRRSRTLRSRPNTSMGWKSTSQTS